MTIDKLEQVLLNKIKAQMPRIMADRETMPADRVVTTLLGDAQVSEALSKFFSDMHAAVIHEIRNDVFFMAVTDGGYGVDRAAAASFPKLAEDNELLSMLEVCEILDGAKVLCESVEDNDIERWYLTRGLQFVRETGAAGGRFYVVPANEADRMLDGFIDDAILHNLRNSGLLEHAPAPAI